MEFRIVIDPQTGKFMVEVWRDNILVATIFSHEEGIQIASTYLDGVQHEAAFVPSIIVKLTKES